MLQQRLAKKLARVSRAQGPVKIKVSESVKSKPAAKAKNKTPVRSASGFKGSVKSKPAAKAKSKTHVRSASDSKGKGSSKGKSKASGSGKGKGKGKSMKRAIPEAARRGICLVGCIQGAREFIQTSLTQPCLRKTGVKLAELDLIVHYYTQVLIYYYYYYTFLLSAIYLKNAILLCATAIHYYYTLLLYATRLREC